MDSGSAPEDVARFLDLETSAQTIIGRRLDQVVCHTKASEDRALLLYGVSSGLFKLTPAGMVLGAGVAGYELTTAIIEAGLLETATVAVQGLADLPADLHRRLHSEDPKVRGEAFVEAITQVADATSLATKLARGVGARSGAGRGSASAAGGEASTQAGSEKLRGQLVGEEIAAGHSFEKHVLRTGEFEGLGIRTREQFALHIESVVNTPSSVRYYIDGRTVYLHESSGTVVIRNGRSGEGTAFRPNDWTKYTATLPLRTTPY